MTRVHKEQEAISMLKSRRFPVREIAEKTGLSKVWIDLKKGALGL